MITLFDLFNNVQLLLCAHRACFGGSLKQQDHHHQQITSSFYGLLSHDPYVVSVVQGWASWLFYSTMMRSSNSILQYQDLIYFLFFNRFCISRGIKTQYRATMGFSSSTVSLLFSSLQINSISSSDQWCISSVVLTITFL